MLVSLRQVERVRQISYPYPCERDSSGWAPKGDVRWAHLKTVDEKYTTALMPAICDTPPRSQLHAAPRLQKLPWRGASVPAEEARRTRCSRHKLANHAVYGSG